uniref:endothelin-1-like n=1 Tax=Myxine glutinosa TaxID=7769 RepID=UPI00358F8177
MANRLIVGALLAFIPSVWRQGHANEMELRGGSHKAVELAVRSSSMPGLNHWRVKRCSCFSLGDEECFYYCHLGIIWIKAPRSMVPYGVGSVHRTRRTLITWPRETLRCACEHRGDKDCKHFCSLPPALNKNNLRMKPLDQIKKRRAGRFAI